MEKRPLPKVTEVLDLHTDLEMDEEYEGHKVEVWKDPSMKIISKALNAMLMDPDALQTMSKENPQEAEQLFGDFKHFVSTAFVDSTIEGVDFSTPLKVEESLGNEELPQAFVYRIVIAYIVRIIARSDTIKKKLAQSS